MSSLPVAPPSLNGWHPDFLEAQYARWKNDPASVGADWATFFLGFDLGRDGAAPSPPPAAHAATDGLAARAASPSDAAHQARQAGVYSLIRSYRRVGHFIANLNPLGENVPDHPLLDPATFGLTDADLDTTFDASILVPPRTATLRDLIAFLRDTYCGTIGAEFMHIQNRAERDWIIDRLEPIRARPVFSHDRHRHLLTKLRLAEGFERYVHTKFIGQKRFSLEGGESLIVALDALVSRAADTHGARDVLFGMAHRGRLNVLVNVMGKSYRLVFSEFQDNYLPDSAEGSGDVKYHKGYSGDFTTDEGNTIHLTLTANPSHLEAVDPVVEGRARARQGFHTRRRLRAGEEPASFEPRVVAADGHFNPIRRPSHLAYPDPRSRHEVVPVLIHGDAAFSGQGVVWETLNLSQLEGYTTGGTVHLITNNQIGFTTLPEDARSTYYCTDVAKGVEAPVFHVNGDDPQAVAFVTELALDYRQTFAKDVVVDILCFRRWGHNESDEPAFTQPQMVERIRAHPGVAERYAQELLRRGEMTPTELGMIDHSIADLLAHEQEEAKSATHTQIMRLVTGQSYGGIWEGLSEGWSFDPVETGVSRERLVHLAERLGALPDGFTPHPKIRRLLAQRRDAVSKDGPLDWGTAEALAFGSLLLDGTPVRLSGQDCRRGTFSHRHAVVVDVERGTEHLPLQHLAEDQPAFEVYDSNLSEFAVMGFELGVSLGDPRTLVVWEAQFGDFANGAQIIIDQFLSSCQTKWKRSSGLVLLLPHGYEGQGPEHSSARLERFLQQSAEENWQVAYPTTPAQIFHLLRRQMKRAFRKPLVVMTPKSLLRLPRATSRVEDMVAGRFEEVLDDPAAPARARRLILCTGKVYYDLVARREEGGHDDVAIVRLEQLYPLHERRLGEAIAVHGNVDDVVWVQEEPRNMGAWTFLAPRLRALIGEEPRYVGRPDAASPAAGSLRAHQEEQRRLLDEAFARDDVAPPRPPAGGGKGAAKAAARRA